MVVPRISLAERIQYLAEQKVTYSIFDGETNGVKKFLLKVIDGPEEMKNKFYSSKKVTKVINDLFDDITLYEEIQNHIQGK